MKPERSYSFNTYLLVSKRLERYYSVISGDSKSGDQGDGDHYETVDYDFLKIKDLKSKAKKEKVRDKQFKKPFTNIFFLEEKTTQRRHSASGHSELS